MPSDQPLPWEFWRACGVTPQPAFILQVPLRHEWKQVAAPLVTAPLELSAVPQRSLTGVVLGPGRIPISGALVELPTLGLSTYTETRGRFYFAALPSGRHYPKQIMVTAKGRQRSVPLDSEQGQEPLTIHFQLRED